MVEIHPVSSQNVAKNWKIICLVFKKVLTFPKISEKAIYFFGGKMAQKLHRLILVLFILFQFTLAQQYEIVWLNEYKTDNLSYQFKNWGQKLKWYVFGKKPQLIRRPFSFGSKIGQNLYFLDQAAGMVGVLFLSSHQFSWLPLKTELRFYSGVDLCDLGDKNLLLTDSGLNNIFVLNKKEGSLSVWNDSLKLDRPTGIEYWRKGRQVVLAETGNHRLLIFDEKGHLKKIIGKRGSNPGEFNFPTFIKVKKDGTIYVVDSMNFRIQVIRMDGKVVSIFGDAGNATGSMARPKGIDVDDSGHIFVVDGLFHTVQVFDIHGNLLTYFGGQGTEPGKFWMPVDVFIDEQNHIFVTDSFNSRIQEFELKSR